MLKRKLNAIKGELLHRVAESVNDVSNLGNDNEIDFDLYYRDCAELYMQIIKISTLDELDEFLGSSFTEFEEIGMGLDYFIKKYPY